MKWKMDKYRISTKPKAGSLKINKSDKSLVILIKEKSQIIITGMQKGHHYKSYRY